MLQVALSSGKDISNFTLKYDMKGRIGVSNDNYALKLTISDISSQSGCYTSLIMNNKGDNDVHFFDSVRFCNALRRLGKKCWMLQYDGEDHNLIDYYGYDIYIVPEFTRFGSS